MGALAAVADAVRDGEPSCQCGCPTSRPWRIDPAGVLPTMWYKDKLILDSEGQLSEAGMRLYPHIRYSRPVDRMTFEQEPLCVSSPRSGAGKDYRVFAAAYMEEGNSYGL